ncbi:helix-turn-helix domain-containing protein [Haloechinothrix sp. LS1_15]|uniref:winged helix-turn-helix transcriptional regulator n=1 Tax=Haloechinothrix sp. LS1_15 TaxID=2652248 RepID=UPI002944937C|nr:helix-turn-helix domain-containing protein [Haloechinothrix sp. LS1_15]MDV6013286.1 helix-turn-helix transcriptional regulator [Haloechinothrix sp. LS1_15]
MPGPNFLCGLDAAIDVVGGKWKALILWALSVQPRRFGELRRELDGVTERVLTQQLRELERDGIVHREVFQQVPPKVVYSLTSSGKALDRALADLGRWGEEHMAELSAIRSGHTLS